MPTVGQITSIADDTALCRLNNFSNDREIRAARQKTKAGFGRTNPSSARRRAGIGACIVPGAGISASTGEAASR